MKQIKVAVIGLGAMGTGHLKTLTGLLSRDFAVTAAADPRAQARRQAAEQFGVPQVFDGPEDLVSRSDFDMAVVATPNHLHWPAIKAVAAKAKIIFCEKPVAHSLDHCRKILRLAGSFNGRFYFDLEFRSDPALRAMKRLIADGRLGKVHMAWCKEFRQPFRRKPTRWIQQQEYSGGTLVEKNVHHFDLFGWLLGARPTAVSACGGRDVVHRLYGAPYTVMDNALVQVEYAGGRRAALLLCMFVDKPLGSHLELGVIGSKGMAVYQADGQRLHATDTSGRKIAAFQPRIPPEIAASSHQGKVYYTYKAILADIRKGDTEIAGVQEAYWATLTGLAAEKSAAQKRRVMISELHRSRQAT